MRKPGSPSIILFPLDVKTWTRTRPSVDEARPRQCPRCGRAGRPAGARLGLVGHGRRERQVVGPTAAEDAPSEVVLAARRYRCRDCGAVVLVVPRGVAPYRHYGAGAIALACFLFAVARKSLTAVRRIVSPRTTTEHGWRAVRRWVQAAGGGRLFSPFVRPTPPDWTCRQRAERIVMTLLSLPPARLPSEVASVFAGAELAA